jgi:hypothetical protein
MGWKADYIAVRIAIDRSTKAVKRARENPPFMIALTIFP